MMSRVHLTVLLATAAAIWAAMLVLEGTSVQFAWARPFGTVVGIVMLLLLAFQKWLWKLPFLHPWFVSVPNLNGTWKGELVSNWMAPQTGQAEPPIEAYLVIRQTFSGLQFRHMTRESASELLAGAIVKEGSATLLAGLYRNTPKVTLRERSQIHHGSILLQIQGIEGNGGLRLEGQYWTDRSTNGTMIFTGRTKRFLDDFERASATKYSDAT